MGQCAQVETGRAGRPDDIPQSPVLGLLWVYLGHWKLGGGRRPSRKLALVLSTTEEQKGHTMIATFQLHNLQTVGHPFL